MARPWAERIAQAYRMADGSELAADQQASLAGYLVRNITMAIILHLSGPDWGYAQVNPRITEWERVMQLPRGYRLLTVDEGAGTVAMGFDSTAR